MSSASVSRSRWLLGGWYFRARSMCRSINRSSSATRRTRRNPAWPIATNATRFAKMAHLPDFPRWRSAPAAIPNELATSKAEATLVNNYIKPGHETPWLVYSRAAGERLVLARDPCEARQISRAPNATRPTASRTRCGLYEVNRISGYSRDIWGHSISRLRRAPHDGMKMSDCEDCHAQAPRRGRLPRLPPVKGAGMKVTRRDLLVWGAGAAAGSHGYSSALEDSGRHFDLEPELAVDSATGARSGRSEAVVLHAVPERMRPASADGGGLAGRRLRA